LQKKQTDVQKNISRSSNAEDEIRFTATQMERYSIAEKKAAEEIEIHNEIIAMREKELREQIEYVKMKPDNDKRPLVGKRFKLKENGMKFEDIVNNKIPRAYEMKTKKDEVTSYSFFMHNFCDNFKMTVSLNIADNVKLIFNKYSNVTFEQIKWAFLACPGVDPKLATEEWVENAYFMIFTKLQWMEKSFDDMNVLTPENILLELKYRYDKEIDRDERPAIRKIVELNEAPGRRMILQVMRMEKKKIDDYCVLTLTDGWYTIKAEAQMCLIDAEIKDTFINSLVPDDFWKCRKRDAARKQQIKEGTSERQINRVTKLIICNAELISPFGSSEKRLKIHANSTRRADWKEKLGFCSDPSPISVPLHKLVVYGGANGRLKLFVTHTFQLSYQFHGGNESGKKN
jgi:breast cancer 2 susceptibility protein